MPQITDNTGGNAKNPSLTLRVRMMRFTAIKEHFVLATVGWLNSYRNILPESPKAYVFPSAKTLVEGDEYEITGYVRKHEAHGLRFHVTKFKKLAGSSSTSWMHKQPALAGAGASADTASPFDGPEVQSVGAVPPFKVPAEAQDSSLPPPNDILITKYPELVKAMLAGEVPTIGKETALRLYLLFGDSLFEFTSGAPLEALDGFGKRKAFSTFTNLQAYRNGLNSKST